MGPAEVAVRRYKIYLYPHAMSCLGFAVTAVAANGPWTHMTSILALPEGQVSPLKHAVVSSIFDVLSRCS